MKTMILSKQQQQWLGVFLISVSLTWGISQLEVNSLKPLGLKTLKAQTLRPEQAAEIVYNKLPYLPQENQYRNVETGEIDPTHTLMSRFIRYHKDFKRRSPQYRLDWKVTLADYLGVNQSIRESNYPGSTLRTSPLAQDIEVIRQLSRRQRQQLLDVLVEIYNPKPQQTTNQSVPNQTEAIPEESSPSTPNLSQPGDAQLLTP